MALEPPLTLPSRAAAGEPFEDDGHRLTGGGQGRHGPLRELVGIDPKGISAEANPRRGKFHAGLRRALTELTQDRIVADAVYRLAEEIDDTLLIVFISKAGEEKQNFMCQSITHTRTLKKHSHTPRNARSSPQLQISTNLK
jgi:hypothetical protein